MNVLIIGAGATGSHVAHRLSMHVATLPTNQRFSIDIHDIAPIRSANMIRQVHDPIQIGENKALALASNLKEAFNIGINGYGPEQAINLKNYNVVFCCVDSYDYRMSMDLEANEYLYIDCGNGYDYGQVISGTPLKHKMFADYDFPKLPETEPSCTLNEAMSRQSLFINTILADVAMWHFLQYKHDGYIPVITPYVTWIDWNKLQIKTQKNQNVSRTIKSKRTS